MGTLRRTRAILAITSIAVFSSFFSSGAIATQSPPNAETLQINTSIGTVSSWSSANLSLPWDRRVIGYLIKDKSGVSQTSNSFFSTIYFKRNEANCWQIAAVNQFGPGPWSNEVCYSPPLPSTPSLTIYVALGQVSSYYSSSGYGDLAVIKFLVRDNFGVTERGGSYFGSIFFDKKISNCWEIAAVSAVGPSEWSNKVCYQVPLPRFSPSTNSDERAVSCSGGIVTLRWAYTYISLYEVVDDIVVTDNLNNVYSVLPNQTTAQIQGIDCLIPRTYAIAFRNTSGIGPVTQLGTFTVPKVNSTSGAANSNGASGLPSGRIGALCADNSVVSNTSKNACSKRGGRISWLFSGGSSYSQPSVGSDCVGLCYGVPSKVNGLPRNKYVSGYFRKDGTYVKPYTRSK